MLHNCVSTNYVSDQSLLSFAFDPLGELVPTWYTQHTTSPSECHKAFIRKITEQPTIDPVTSVLHITA